MTMQIPPRRMLLVELEQDLHHSRVTGLFHNLLTLPGIVSVADMSMVSQVRIDQIVMKPEGVEIVTLPPRDEEWQEELAL